MKNLKTYKLFVESYDEIMKDMADDVNIQKIKGAEEEMVKLKKNLDTKKAELEKRLQGLEDMQVDTATEDNQKKVEDAKKNIEETIGKLKTDIDKYQKDIDDTKSKIQTFNDQKNQKLQNK